MIKKNFKKWFHPVYGKYLLNNISMYRFGTFSGLITPHFPSSLNKTQMEKVWEELHEEFDNTCSHRFRSPEDINQYTFRFWNMMTGNFYPTNFDKYARFVAVNNNNANQICNLIENSSLKLLCMNDSKAVENFEAVQAQINQSFEKRLPQKSGFEL